ncbi:ferritin [Synechococcus sp. CS-1325]|uniref:ferritin n=1 Tax=unclassified Synechococcus TaxID=2626047 RepID=UPI000DB16F16|nr:MULTISPECIES: ferritin [unclassified Synechococcus]PZU99680.1 MAG: ferritin [Cyanobium sp.]MCT0200332.1 ferritin [Synechococcus sp. CS-1325]MCT0214028.1 ferritin [Synechococcus sp. CS-1326]MCT0230094.1 ferritin [Synechococcus sp. CS-1324]MCT0233604.1 ferritin [Synechococcus sp. CS-1327]
MTLSTQPVAGSLQSGGRPVAQPIQESLLEALQQHLAMELNASASYWALAIWFAERELRGFSHHFKQESDQERNHAGLFADYLIARGQPVALGATLAPRQVWSDIEDILAAVFQMEVDVTTSLHQLYAMAEQSGDVRTTVYLDPLIDKQTASEDEAAHLLGRLRLAAGNPAALLILDTELANGQAAPSKIGE